MDIIQGIYMYRFSLEIADICLNSLNQMLMNSKLILLLMFSERYRRFSLQFL